MTNTPQVPRTLFSFFGFFLKPYKRYLAGMFVVSVLWAAHISLLPYILKLLVDRSHAAQTPQEVWAALLWPAIAYVGLSAALGAVFRFYDYIMMKFLPFLKRDVAHAMFQYLEGHSHSYFQDHFAGALSNKVMDMTRGVSEILQMVMDTCTAPLCSVTSGLITMCFVNPYFALIFGVWAIFFMTASWQVAKKCQPYATAYSEGRSTVSGKVVDSISNMANVRLFARRSFENYYLLGFTNDLIIKDQAMQRFLIYARTGLMLSITTMVGLMLYGLITAKSRGLITAGDFVLILMLTGRIVDFMWQMTNQFVRLSQEVGTCEQALTIITRSHDLQDISNAPALQIQQGAIDFNTVTFRYHKAAVFDQLALSLSGGSKVGLVGFSGSGKTTFVNLILRFFDLESGQILIDGQDISQVSQDSLHAAISMIPQDTSLFHRSLMDNIRYGKIDASDDEVIQAAKQAHCDEFIQHLPEKYASLVGERGIKLSGGQRQRIAIARAMLKNAPILILDEATSALDSVTEGQIQDSLRQLMQGRTTIVIAHRLSTLSEMDRLLVFDHGKIVQDGSHEDLIAVPGHYQQLWQLQANGFLPG